MGKNLGGAIIDLLDSERVDLRAAASTVLAAVGKGDRSVEAALAGRLSDADRGVRRIALEGLAGMGASGIAARLVPLLSGDDEALAERAAQVLAEQGADAEDALRTELGAGPVAARRVIAQLLLRRGTQPAVEAVLGQLADPELGEQVLQLVRHEIEQGNEKLNEKLIKLIEKLSLARTTAAGKELAKAVAKAEKAHQAAAAAAAKAAKADKAGKAGKAGKAEQDAKGAKGAKGAKQEASKEAKRIKQASDGAADAAETAADAAAAPAAAAVVDPMKDPDVTRAASELGGLLRLTGYLARPSAQGVLTKHTGPEQPAPIRLAAIAGLRRILAQSEGGGTEKAIETLIQLADGEDAAVAQAAVDTLHGARIPESMAEPFAALAKGRHAFAQKLVQERVPAGGGATVVSTLVAALGGEDPTARDAAARSLARTPEAVLPLTRALLATTDEQLARRYAAALRAHRGHVSALAVDELVDAVHASAERTAKGKSTPAELALERTWAELIADLAPARHVELVFDRARRLHRAGKSVEAFVSLKPLLRPRADLDAAIDDEQRFFLALLALDAAGEGIIRTARADDPIFDQFSRLAAKGFPVAKRLNREQDVSDETIYALGFRLIESGDGAHEDLGAELLQGIIDERPRSKLAKAARNKLRLTGHLDEE
ncbi:MAG TPA: HEAT repeat domain-containing protein [Kofleriaceae bacterium]|nr:HEAT repeat domain-containing protein [Kofleriaceae bacterium]